MKDRKYGEYTVCLNCPAREADITTSKGGYTLYTGGHHCNESVFGNARRYRSRPLLCPSVQAAANVQLHKDLKLHIRNIGR